MHAEARRVVRPDGPCTLGFAAGPTGEAHYPSTSARDSSMSFLAEPEELRRLAVDAGFAEMMRDDGRHEGTSRGCAAPLGLSLLMGGTTAGKVANLRQDLEEDRLRVVRGVFGPASWSSYWLYDPLGFDAGYKLVFSRNPRGCEPCP